MSTQDVSVGLWSFLSGYDLYSFASLHLYPVCKLLLFYLFLLSSFCRCLISRILENGVMTEILQKNVLFICQVCRLKFEKNIWNIICTNDPLYPSKTKKTISERRIDRMVDEVIKLWRARMLYLENLPKNLQKIRVTNPVNKSNQIKSKVNLTTN